MVEDPLLHEQAHVLEKIGNEPHGLPFAAEARFELRRAEGAPEVRLLQARRELVQDELLRRSETVRLDGVPQLGQRGDLIAAAHVAQLNERGGRRRGDDDERADGGEGVDPLG
ncbi:MAG: hypothetical protein GIW95_01630 [Candidatus Eremiobacteraeota bacterium]|nr:hypothetical protein [Candidatus Eremiobacteraeota bacterium]